MTLDEITKEILEAVRENYEIGDDPDYTSDVNLFDYGYLDSLGAVQLTEYLEEKYSIEITQRDIVLYSMSTVDEIAEVVFSKLN